MTTNIDLILKDIQDQYARENFTRLTKFINAQDLFTGDFNFFDVTIPGANDSFAVPHGLTFIPEDIIALSAFGDQNYYFRYQDNDRTNIYISNSGPVRLRFLAGRLSDKAGQDPNAGANFELIPPGASEPTSGIGDQVIGKITIFTDSIFEILGPASFAILDEPSGTDTAGMQIKNLVRINADSSMEIDTGSSVLVLGA